jgi:hypothetical protein
MRAVRNVRCDTDGQKHETDLCRRTQWNIILQKYKYTNVFLFYCAFVDRGLDYKSVIVAYMCLYVDFSECILTHAFARMSTVLIYM